MGISSSCYRISINEHAVHFTYRIHDCMFNRWIFDAPDIAVMGMTFDLMIIGAAAVTWSWIKVENYVRSRPMKQYVEKTPGFFSQAYSQIKNKYCSKLEITHENS